ncbi:amidohydrolase family protein [Ottowia sp.]|uniref:amidohydrolase family protein n=1 Tax=Ottowia sp. TaxID=1898956 RepID=UPI0039E4197F
MVKLPAGACNAHCHVFGPRERFAYAPDAPFVPQHDAPKEALFALNDRLGLQRCVVVQSACHGFDNSAAEDAVAARPQDYRAIALLPADVGNGELRRLDACGFRGVRFNFMGHLGSQVPVADILALATRLEPLGWHLQLHGAPAMLGAQAQALRESPVPVVIDHMGRADAALGLNQPAFRQLMQLMAGGRFWVKLSGMDRMSRTGAPYVDAQPFARALMDSFADRVLWGNDWPHPNHAGPIPDEDELVRLIVQIAPAADLLELLMVQNPQRLYRFG